MKRNTNIFILHCICKSQGLQLSSTLNMVESASFQSCFPPCFQGTLKILLSRSIQASPWIFPASTLDSSQGLIRCRECPLSIVTSKILMQMDSNSIRNMKLYGSLIWCNDPDIHFVVHVEYLQMECCL